MGRRRYRRARHRRTLAIVFVVFLLVCLGVLVAVVAVNALAFEGPDSRATGSVAGLAADPDSRSP